MMKNSGTIRKKGTDKRVRPYYQGVREKGERWNVKWVKGGEEAWKNLEMGEDRRSGNWLKE